MSDIAWMHQKGCVWAEQLGYGYVDGKRVNDPVEFITAIQSALTASEAAREQAERHVSSLTAALRHQDELIEEHMRACMMPNRLAVIVERDAAIAARDEALAELAELKEGKK